MKNLKIKKLLSITLAVTMMLTVISYPGSVAKADSSLPADLDEKFVIKESEINQLLTEDLELPQVIDGLSGATITYSTEDADASYVSVQDNVLKVTRPYASEEDYSFSLTATVEHGTESYTKKFPLTIRAGLSDDSYAGYIYTSFASKFDNGSNGYRDDQQVHFFLSEDGMNWTALNGFNPAFLAGSDYKDYVEPNGNINYSISPSAKIEDTVKGDASVLFPFEGNDQGIRDPYLLRGAKADGSDADKIWILATDLNTMDEKYTGIKATNKVGDWGIMSSRGSTSLFIYETEDFVNWERRWVDVGSEISAGAAWAPEAIYNPEKDNYLVYWSCRVHTDGLSRNRIYCNETDDFVTFGPTKMYEQEAFYLKYAPGGENDNDGYGNIDTSQLWVADEDGNPYGTVYRVVKDETTNHIELMSSDTVLDPAKEYELTDPNNITPYTRSDGVTYSQVSELPAATRYASTSSIIRAEIVYNWFINETVGNHFEYIQQSNIERTGAYEGATLFKFIDRDEWCIMIDNYGDNSIRYEPYVTYDLSEPNSIKKVSSNYGRTGGDVGTHGGMIPITVKEYNTLIDTFNSDPAVDNYHEIDYIEVDRRDLLTLVDQIETFLEGDTSSYTIGQTTELRQLQNSARRLMNDRGTTTAQIDEMFSTARQMIGNLGISVDKTTVNVEAGKTATVKAITNQNHDVFWTSANPSIATVENGVITGVTAGTTVITARSAANASVQITVTVTGTAPQPVTPPSYMAELNQVTAEAAKAKLAKGKATTVKITYPSVIKALNPKVTYKASGAVSVNSSGKITGKSSGTGKVAVTITIPSTGEKVTKNVTVKVGAITNKSVKAGKSVKLKVKGLSGKVTWSITKKKNLATINKKTGKLKAKKKGTVTVQAKVGNVKIQQKIVIKKK